MHIGLNHKENNFKKSEFLDSMDSLKSNLDKHTILSEKKRKKIGQNDEIRTPVNLSWLRCWAYFTTVMTKNLTITQIPHISAHFNLYHVKEHQKLSFKLSSLILCGLVFSCNLQKTYKNPKFTVGSITLMITSLSSLTPWSSG